jgi:voltage-gated potassium channel
MKFLSSQLAYLTGDREARTNLRALAKYLGFLAALVSLYALMFHVIKLQVEHEQHSWVTGFYWTLVVMTTLGFGDITFTSDIGRMFSIIVLLSGVVFLLVMLPFLFIRLFYAPWLEARVRLRAPREVPHGMSGHLIIAEYDAIAAGLIERCAAEAIPYVVIEPNPTRAGQLMDDGVFVLAGENDNRVTYERAAAAAARLVLANCEDTTNTNITLTVREIAPDVTIASLVEEEDSVDILTLSGATSVLPLKQQLGEYLANRTDVGTPEAHVVGTVGARHAFCGAAGWRHEAPPADGHEHRRVLGTRQAAARVSADRDPAGQCAGDCGNGSTVRGTECVAAPQRTSSPSNPGYRRRQGRPGRRPGPQA